MEKFLRGIAVYVFEKYPNNMDELTLIFPNRRSSLFFLKYLSELIDKPQLSPKIITIADFVSDLTQLQIADQHSLLYELYHAFCAETNLTESFDDFYYWGEMLLSDFNDVDKYLVDAKQLFSNMEALKDIELEFDFLTNQQIEFLSSFWDNIVSSKDSANKEYFLTIWRKLFAVYTSFKSSLIEKNQAFEGMLYREVVENLKTNPVDLSNDKYCVVGFNALNACEIKLFDYLSNASKTSFFWDFDKYYMDKEIHEASLFMKANILRYPMPADFYIDQNNFAKLSSIDIVAIPGKTGQSAYASHWINSIKNDISYRFDNTAIVLCDESLLDPIIRSVPEYLSDVNITMGFPMKSTLAYSLVKGIASLDKNSRKDENANTIFYFRNVVGFLNHPLLKPLLGADVDYLNKDIIDKNKIYLSTDDFLFSEKLAELLAIPDEVETCKQYLFSILKSIFDILGENDLIEKDTIHNVYLAINRLHDSLFTTKNAHNINVSKRLFYQLLIRQLDSLTIPFEGEPLTGLQIMGFLETRCLDFEHILLVSANDDKLPGKAHNHSFIPYSLRKGFGLPVIEQRQAMYAYYFYRLIQRAKKVTLIYDSRTEGMNRGEITRFANQLKYEASHLNLTEKKAVFDHQPSLGQAIVIEKNGKVMETLLKKLKSKLISPSAINVYLDCNLRFYFRYVEELYEVEELAEEMDNLIFGRVAHVALEEIYRPMLGKEISKEDIEAIIKNELLIQRCLSKALEKEYFKGGKIQLKGNNILVYDIIYKYLLKILGFDKQLAPFVITGLEKKYAANITIEKDGEPFIFNVGGVIDRIDRISNRIRIVDYKTGISDNVVKNIPSLFLEKVRNKAAFQTMVYAYCLAETDSPAEDIIPTVYGARSIFKEDFDPSFLIEGKELVYQQFSSEFIEQLKSIFNEWLNVDCPFTQTTELAKCNRCPYNIICRR